MNKKTATIYGIFRKRATIKQWTIIENRWEISRKNTKNENLNSRKQSRAKAEISVVCITLSSQINTMPSFADHAHYMNKMKDDYL